MSKPCRIQPQEHGVHDTPGKTNHSIPDPAHERGVRGFEGPCAATLRDLSAPDSHQCLREPWALYKLRQYWCLRQNGYV